MCDPKIVENVLLFLLILFIRFSFMRDVRNCSYPIPIPIPSNSMYFGNSMYYIAKKTAQPPNFQSKSERCGRVGSPIARL